jgi:putative ABC transport system permease protein
MTLAVAGLVIGLGIASAAASFVGRLLFHVSAHDPSTFAMQAGVLIVACFLAAFLPARRASRVDPMAALRVD